MNILITGCNGQLGNEMQLLEQENPQHTYYNTDVAELDITDQTAIEQFVNDNHIDGIVNCAAYTAVDKAEDNEELCTKLNAEAPAYLAHAIGKRGGWMIQISTDYVFDGTNHTPYTEDEDTCPNSVYGKTKLVGELNVQKLCERSMIIRTAWLYSTFGNNFVKTMIRLGNEKPELGVIFDQIGTLTRVLSHGTTSRRPSIVLLASHRVMSVRCIPLNIPLLQPVRTIRCLTRQRSSRPTALRFPIGKSHCASVSPSYEDGSRWWRGSRFLPGSQPERDDA